MSEKWGPYVGGHGNPNSKLAIVGIAPGADEVLKQRPFVGPSGNLLRQDLHDAGYNLDDAWKTNVFKYKLPDNEFAKYKEIELSLEDAMKDLREELYDVNPNCILGLGDPVLYSLAGKSGKYNNISFWRGSILEVLGRKAVFTWHPAAELHGSGEGTFASWQKYVRKFDVKRAVDESKTRDLDLPKRLIHIAHSSSDVYRFFEKNSAESYVAIDIESIQGIPVCIGFSFLSHEAMVVPLWNTLPISVENKKHPKKSYSYSLEVSTIPTNDLAYIWQFLSLFFLNQLSFGGKTKPHWKKIGQNFKYDEDKINKLGFYLDYLYWDIQIGHHCIASETPKNLAFQTSINTREPYYKLEGKEFIPGKDKIEIFFNYNGKDSCVTREIFNTQIADLKNINYGLEHTLWRMKLHKAYLHIDKQGFAVDELQRKYLIHKYVDQLVKLEVELFEITKSFGLDEPVNVRSHPQVNKLVYYTMKVPMREGVGEKVLTALMANIVKDRKILRAFELIMEIRQVDKTIGYLQSEPDLDGRMKTTFLITGTENFRTSTHMLEPPIRQTKSGWAFHTVTKHGDVGQDLRSILEPDAGYVIVNMDQSQAEARVCSHLAGDVKTLRDYDTMDKHAATAALFFSGKESQYNKKRLGYECPERFVGKTLRHAYHLDIGKREAMINVNTDARKYKINLNISEWFAGQCLQKLEKDTPLIKSVFHAEIRRLLGDSRRLFGTFSASRYFYDDEGRDLWKGGYSFIPQQTVSDKTKYVLLKIIDKLPDVKVVVEAHDALAMMIREKVLLERIEEIKEWFLEPIAFDRCSIKREDLVIPCDVEFGYNYKELKNFKFPSEIAA